MSSGARQWRIPCQHLDGRPAERAMHSEVTRSNLRFFASEARVTGDVSESELREWLTKAEKDDGSLVVCNDCRRVKITDRDDGNRVVVHGGGRR